MRVLIGLLVAVLVVLAGCAQAPLAPTASDDISQTTTEPTPTDSTPANEATTTEADGEPTTTEAPPEQNHPPDPDTDVLGWENGYWHNETIDADSSDGLNDSELKAVIARSMARIEQIRKLEFEDDVPVSVLSRSEFQQQQQKRGTGDALRTFDNAKFESLFLINESTDSIAVQNRNRGSSVLGYYDPKRNEIVVVSENESLQIDEFTLAHELVHAIQDQKFNLSEYNRKTRDGANADSGLVEGDARYTETLYKNRCDGEWDCLPTNSQSGGGDLANIGVYLVKYQPYSDGPAFIRGVRNEGGWDAVNALYENPPASTEQVIHSNKYGSDAPADVKLADKSSDAWQQVTVADRPDYGSVGEAAVFSMFMYPAYHSEGKEQVIPPNQFFNRNEDGDLRDIDPLNYNHSYSDGWDGDRLFVYQNDEGETGYVWKLVWDSEQDAKEFVTGYEKVLQYWNAEKIDDRENTWVIPESESFADAFYVKQEGNTVTIVNAPRTEDLSEVREGAAPKNSTN